MDTIVYDYAIIGAGAAGLHLALAMQRDAYFNNKTVLLLDKEPKDLNDKTWCFWEKGDSIWDSICTKVWKNAVVGDGSGQVVLDLSPYNYKAIRAIDFYTWAKSQLSGATNIQWRQDTVEKVESLPARMTIHTPDHQYAIKEHIFDSRITPDFEKDETSTKLLQHFKGFVIKTKNNRFDDSQFVMMDFSLRWKDSTSFTYVLPYSKQKALVEFTFFNEQLIQDEEYDHMLNIYISEHLKIDEYTVEHVEQGIIPMSDYRFHTENSTRMTKIGTAGGWVKPSSGYSFKNAERNSKKIVENLKSNKAPSKSLLSTKHRFYDSIFLSVLSQDNQLGPQLFTTMYTANPIQRILAFLDENTSFLEDLKIMNTFPKVRFGKAALQKLLS